MTMTTRWRAVHDGQRVEMELRPEGLYFEVGAHDNVKKRGHEGTGGTLSLDQFRAHPEYFEEFPGFHERVLSDLEGPGVG
ncbi:MAG: hypothetical protein KDA24_25780 [Deltaproteobacteria bacterium]|nr:hypothetical protein [Deltaproteobacteria bacterium]